MTDQIAIVTGTSSGIGAALTEHLLNQGWYVFGLARRDVTHFGEGYQHIQIDLADSRSLDQLAPRIEAELAFRTVTRFALVNNAATTGQLRNYGTLETAGVYRDMAINLAAPVAMMNLAVRLRPEGAALRVVNLSSGLAYRPLAGAAAYCSSKAGLHMAGEVFAEESAGNSALLNYAPGIVDTEMQQTLRGTTEGFVSVDVFKAMHDEDRLASPGDVLDPMIDFLNADGLSGFYEARFQPG